MDKALVFGAKDCRLESCQGHVKFSYETWVCSSPRLLDRQSTQRQPHRSQGGHPLNFIHPPPNPQTEKATTLSETRLPKVASSIFKIGVAGWWSLSLFSVWG